MDNDFTPSFKPFSGTSRLDFQEDELGKCNAIAQGALQSLEPEEDGTRFFVAKQFVPGENKEPSFSCFAVGDRISSASEAIEGISPFSKNGFDWGGYDHQLAMRNIDDGEITIFHEVHNEGIKTLQDEGQDILFDELSNDELRQIFDDPSMIVSPTILLVDAVVEAEDCLEEVVGSDKSESLDEMCASKNVEAEMVDNEQDVSLNRAQQDEAR